MSSADDPVSYGPRIAIIGMGPRGISVLERLALRADDRPGPGPVVFAIDAVQVGCGRIWRTDQQPWFTMNTVAGQVTMYSGEPDGGPDRAGAGPSLAQWLARSPDPALSTIGPDGYAPRVTYGHYLRHVYRSVVDHLPEGMVVRPVTARVTSMAPLADGGYELALSDRSEPLVVDRVVLATGHPVSRPGAAEQAFADFTATRPGLTYLSGDSAADLPLDAVEPGTSVGVIGMGLGFYDILLSLTVGRGGVFRRDIAGAMRYTASGREPRIFAGSRSGMPILARGTNQKRPDHVHPPVVFTVDAVRAAKARAGAAGLDFAAEIMPLIQAEVDHVHLTTLVRCRHGEAVAERFAERHARILRDGGPKAALMAEHGLAPDAGLDLERLARPFAGTRFAHPAAFRAKLLDLMARDIDEAKRGNVDGPVKAALDVLRDIRNTIRVAVDFGGLTVRSHRDDFLGRYVPMNALLSAGPPVERVEQLLALIEVGVVTVVGPHVRYECDPARGAFVMSSADVTGSRTELTALVDARIPQPDLRRDTSPLYEDLVARGLVTQFVEHDPVTGEVFETGGVDVTPAPFALLDRHGAEVPGVHALGLPTEHTRWFTQVGSGRPGMRTLFLRDADAVAERLLTPSPVLTPR
ncbi:FAD/NAD(P)-binding protein [Saccharothrix sp. S26]|uniref:FAD/NAD(P)-binding protein n=1 Tax=Saccharothrix sp. S26 TaxID=2907215 RepID=UPI001F2AE65B|nr:FAD/NAD(P)-binding protein [Saccharothrix sp. S26]MCE7001184.1 FAD/NAD(P)-binding protein [Saccharothrix sp. S26]